MRTLNLRGALVFAVLFLALAVLFGVYFPSDTDVHFSVESGFYDEPVMLEMTCAVPGAEIYYTLDGSAPDERSQWYDGPVEIVSVVDDPNVLSAYTGITFEDYVPEASMMKGTVVRAAALYPNGEWSPVQHASYFVGVDREEEYGDVPVVSLIVNEDDFFDYEYGIYVLGITFDDWYAEQTEDEYEWWQVDANFYQCGREWERKAHVEYLPADGSEGFAQTMGVRIKGAGSRTDNQKSLRLIARDEYGADRLHYPILGENERAGRDGLVSEYKSFVLRSGGNDGYFAKVRDPMIQHLAQDMKLDTQSTAPCIVFINGEYWGLYIITEEYSPHYIEENHGIEKENAVIIKKGYLDTDYPEDEALYQEMFDFISQNDMTVEENYQKACAMIDVENWVDFLAVQSYVDNMDGLLYVNNNWMMWRARTMDSSRECGDGRWRFMLYDVDSSADLGGAGHNVMADNLSRPFFGELTENDSYLWQVIRSLYRNDDFRRELVTALCDVRNIHFEVTRAIAQRDALREVYEPLMGDSLYRFGPQELVDWGAQEHCESEMSQLGWFFEGRWEPYPALVQQALGLQPPVWACVETQGDGTVQVNRAVPEMEEGYWGQYFPDYPITLTALETGEGRFVRWEGEGCEIADPYALSTEVSFQQDFSVRAVFE